MCGCDRHSGYFCYAHQHLRPNWVAALKARTQGQHIDQRTRLSIQNALNFIEEKAQPRPIADYINRIRAGRD